MRSLFLLLLASLLGAQPRNGPQMLWPFVADLSTTSTIVTSAAGNWVAFGFRAAASKTLSEIHVNIDSVTGSLGSGDLRLALYSDSSAKPGTETEGINSSGTPAAGWNSITGYTASVTAGTYYWVVVRNMNATPASNYFTIVRLSGSVSTMGIMNAGVNVSAGWMSASTTDSGTNWTRSASMVGAVIVWSDGTKSGFPIGVAGCGSTTQCQIYSSREAGLMLQTGATGFRVIGVAGQISRTSTPTGAYRYRVYEGTGNSRTLLGTTSSGGTLTTSITYAPSFFSSSILLKAYTWYSIVLSEETNSDASTLRYNVQSYKLSSTHGALFAGALGANLKSTLSTDGGSTWTDSSDEYPMLALILDPVAPFIFPSGGFATVQ